MSRRARALERWAPRSRVARRGPALVGASAVGQALDLLATLLATRALGVEGFGVFVAARAVTGLVDAALGARSWEAVLAFSPRFEREGDRGGAEALVTLAMAIEAALALAGLVVVGLLGALCGPAFTAAAAGGAVLPLVYARHAAENLVEIHHAAFRLHERYAASAAQVVLAPLLRVGLFAWLLASGAAAVLPFAAADGGAAVLGWLLGLAAGVATGRLPLRSDSRIRVEPYVGELRRFLMHNWVAGSVRGVSAYGAEFLLSVRLDAATVGAFGIARRLAGVLSFTLSPFLYIVTPAVYRVVATGDAAATRRLLVRVTRYCALPLGVLDGLLVLFGDRLVAATAGPDFVAAGRPLLLLAAGFTVQLLFSWARPAALAIGASGPVLWTQIGAAATLIAGTVALAPALGASGAAAAVLASYVVQVGLLLAIVSRGLRALAATSAARGGH